MPKNPSASAAKAQRKRRPKNGVASNRLTIILGLGSTGAKFEQWLRKMESRLRGVSIVIDGEISSADAAQHDHLVATSDASIGDHRARASRVALVAEDSLILSLKLPFDSERGAGACRPLGTLKAASVLDLFRQKLNRIIRRRLVTLDSQDRLIANLHIVSASCGGFGSGLLAIMALLARDELRKVAPQARCNVIVHLILSSNFEPLIADPRIRQKVGANEFASFLEMNYTQAPRNVAHLAELLGCEPVPVPTFDRVIPYHVSDESGRTATVQGVLAERVLPNVVAGDNAGLADRLREVASNTLALQHGGVEAELHPFVSVSQAATARAPDQFGESWAVMGVINELTKVLAKPSSLRLKVFEGPIKNALGIEGLRAEIARACSEPVNDVLVRTGSVKKKSATDAHASLTEAHERYQSAVKTTVEARCRTLLEHHEGVTTPNTMEAILDALVEREATVAEVALALRGLRKDTDDYADRVNRESEKAAAVVKVRREKYNELMQRLLMKPWLPGRVNEQAAEALNDLVNAENLVQRHRTLYRLTRMTSEALSSADAEVVLVHREGVRALGRLKSRFREAKELATAQSPTITSIIKPEEFQAAVSQLDRGIRGVNESLPTLDTKALVQGGHMGVVDQVESVIDRRVVVFDDFYESNLNDVSGTVRALKLSFSVAKWIENTVKGLTCCSPVALSAAGEAEAQTVVAACGDDLEAVQQYLRRNPLIGLLDAVPGSDPRMIVLHRRVEGLTIEAIPTFRDARRAARAFPKPGPGLTAWETLAASGHVLGAYDQDGLIPEEWRSAPLPLTHHRQGLPEEMAANGQAR